MFADHIFDKVAVPGTFLKVIDIVADCDNLLYHLIVLLSSKGYRIEDVIKKLRERHK